MSKDKNKNLVSHTETEDKIMSKNKNKDKRRNHCFYLQIEKIVTINNKLCLLINDVGLDWIQS